MLALAAGGADGQGQGDREYPADSGGGVHRGADAGGCAGVGMGQLSGLLLDHGWQRAPQCAFRFRQCQTQRQNRDEVARGREPRECADVHRGG